MRKNVLCLERKQKGAAAIEFAFVFPVFFLVFYGIITYGIIFLAQQSITLAAAEGARAALRYAATDTVRDTNARAAATGTGSAAAWLGTRINLSVWQRRHTLLPRHGYLSELPAKPVGTLHSR
jgi:Flp pilus assembly protein TadG